MSATTVVSATAVIACKERLGERLIAREVGDAIFKGMLKMLNVGNVKNLCEACPKWVALCDFLCTVTSLQGCSGIPFKTSESFVK